MTSEKKMAIYILWCIKQTYSEALVDTVEADSTYVYIGLKNTGLSYPIKYRMMCTGLKTFSIATWIDSAKLHYDNQDILG